MSFSFAQQAARSGEGEKPCPGLREGVAEFTQSQLEVVTQGMVGGMVSGPVLEWDASIGEEGLAIFWSLWPGSLVGREVGCQW